MRRGSLDQPMPAHIPKLRGARQVGRWDGAISYGRAGASTVAIAPLQTAIADHTPYRR